MRNTATRCLIIPSANSARFPYEPREKSWRGALVTKAVGGYGYSGWIWEIVDRRFQIKQGPKLIHLETSTPA